MILSASIIGICAALRRTCPNCGHYVLAPATKKRERVTCKRCGVDVPPPHGMMRESTPK